MLRSTRKMIVMLAAAFAYAQSGLALAEETEGEGVQGRLDKRNGVSVVVADRLYQVNSLTRIVDEDGNAVLLSDVHPGRDMRVESAIELGTAQPIATRIIVLDPH